MNFKLNALIFLVSCCAWQSHAMLPRLGHARTKVAFAQAQARAKLLTLQKKCLHESTSREDRVAQLAVLSFYSVAGTTVGMLGTSVGAVAGYIAGTAIALVPAGLANNDKIIEMGGSIGGCCAGLAGGTAASVLAGGLPGFTAWGITCTALYCSRYLKEKDEPFDDDDDDDD